MGRLAGRISRTRRRPGEPLDLNMKDSATRPMTVMGIGASGQDGYFLTERLLDEQCKVHAIVRRPEALAGLRGSETGQKLLEVHTVELATPQALFDLIARERPAAI